MKPKIAVVVGATNGIGKGIACRLAQEGYQIIAVGRQKEGRKNEILQCLQECTNSGAASSESKGSSNNIKHEFRPCNAFELAQVKQCAQDIVRDNAAIDALVMTQGMVSERTYDICESCFFMNCPFVAYIILYAHMMHNAQLCI